MLNLFWLEMTSCRDRIPSERRFIVSKGKLVNDTFSTPQKYILKSTDGKGRKSIAHRYERRRIRESLRHGDFLNDA